MSAVATQSAGASRLALRYEHSADPRRLLGPHTLAVFGFGDAAPRTLDDPRYVHVGLQPACSPGPFEIWESSAPVQLWHGDGVHGASDGELAFGWIECREGADGIAAAAEHVYRQLLEHVGRSAYPHLLRIWNYLDAITEGDGDSERYRQFCVGRAAGLRLHPEQFPAATAIGRRDGRRVLQVYWLCAREPGTPLENPRQIAAYRYPRQYGPRPPSFARAMLASTPAALPLMLSGTAAVVGHASQHVDDLKAQIHESFQNFDALICAARARAPGLAARFGAGSLLKAYVRNGSDIAAANALLDDLLAPEVPRLVLQGEVCRRELLIELDGFHGA